MLKSNIDLTNNEMFSRRQITINFEKRQKIPWNIAESFIEVHSDKDLGYSKFEGILTGNKSQRQRRKMYMAMDSGDYCDCCGTYLKKIPWDRTYGVCRKCYKRMEDDPINKRDFPWVFKTYSLNLSEIIFK